MYCLRKISKISGLYGRPQESWSCEWCSPRHPELATRGDMWLRRTNLLCLVTSQQIDLIDGKGRGVIATKQFSRGEFVVEYHGDLIEITDAKKREALYAQDPSTGCYMYYFQCLSKTYW